MQNCNGYFSVTRYIFQDPSPTFITVESPTDVEIPDPSSFNNNNNNNNSMNRLGWHKPKLRGHLFQTSGDPGFVVDVSPRYFTTGLGTPCRRISCTITTGELLAILAASCFCLTSFICLSISSCRCRRLATSSQFASYAIRRQFFKRRYVYQNRRIRLKVSM